MPSPAEFTYKANRVRAFLQRGTRTVIRVEGVKHFKQSFRDEGFTDQGLEKWPDITEKRKAQKRKRNGDLKPILTDTGELGNSITGTEVGSNVVFSSDKDYAERHNLGLKGMPKRQFIGKSATLDRRIEAKLNKEIRRLFGL